MQTRGERHVSNARMQNLLEFLSDLPADEVIDKQMRCKRKVIDFIFTVIHEKGRRGQDNVMPIDYTKHGPYMMKHIASDKVEIKCKLNKKLKS